MSHVPRPTLARTTEVPELDAAEFARYGRHIALPQVGVTGQRRLKASRVLVVGAGGLGSPAALFLAAAGVGTLGLVDFDVVDVTNLHRQVLHGTSDVGRQKLDSAADRLHDVNPNTHLERHDTRLAATNAMEIMRGYDVVLDGTDNFATRYLVNDACVLLGIPNVYGSIFRFEGQASLFATPDGPCYRCLYPEPPPPGTVPSCAEGGVIGVLPGLVGTIQATEAIKHILGIGESLARRLLLIDALTLHFHDIRIKRDPSCPACGTRTLTSLIDYDEFCGTAAPSANADQVPTITPQELRERMTRDRSFTLIDVREPEEWAEAHVDGATLVPLRTLGTALRSWDPAQEFVMMCRSGARSAEAVRQMQQAGFKRASSLAGGMLAWSAL